MLRIPQSLRGRTIGILNAGLTINAVAMNIGCSTRAIRHLRQGFQAKGRTEDRPRSGRWHVTMHGQDCYYLVTSNFSFSRSVFYPFG